jgi:hypothetical protein
MEYLVKNDLAKNVWIRYNTNFSRTTYKHWDLKELLPHFKMVQICASIDGTGEIVEYVRHGIKWDQWIQNFKEYLFLNNQYGDYGIAFDLTITTPGLFSLKDLFDLAVNLDVHTLIKTTFAFDSQILMCPQALPRELFDEVIDDIIDYIQPRAVGKHSNWIPCLLDLKQRKVFSEQYPDYREGFINGKKRLERIDRWRKNDDVLENIYLKHNKKVYDWWKSNTI